MGKGTRSTSSEKDTSSMLSAWHEPWVQAEEHRMKGTGERGWGAILKKPWEDEVVVAHTFNCCAGRWGAQRPADCLTPQEVRVTTVLPTRSLVGMGEGFQEL